MSARTWKQGALAIPGVGVSLLPKLMCPACWPAYAGILSSVGLGFLISAAYLLPITAVFLALAVGSLGFRASRRHGLWPFWIGLGSAIVILTGKFYFDSASAMYGGVSLLILGSVWNAWPRRPVGFCPVCVPAEADSVTTGTQGKGEMQQ